MDTLHKKGDTVVCVHASGYPLTTGKQYTVVAVVPVCHMDDGYVFPSYVVVVGDLDEDCVCHHYRFRPATQ